MLFPTLTFAVFFAAYYPLSWAVRSRPAAWKWLALVASYIFYAFWDWRFVSLIAASTLINGVIAQGIGRASGKGKAALLAVAVVFDVALLATFKYFGFFAETVHRLADDLGATSPVPFVDVVLPIGISFYTFQAISYVVDVYRGDAPPAPLLDFAVLQAFFPHLVAGPIVRAGEFIPQLGAIPALRRVDATRAAVLISSGLFKKIVVSSYVATSIVDPVFANPGSHGSVEILVAIYAYAVQIYADFSGYTDIAIGVALLLGIRLPDNFDRPYAASSVRDFWRRWHMTLSRWLRDYLYIPLGGSRGGRARTYRNLIVTMAIGGLWHGAGGTFVLWGLFHGLALSVERSLSGRWGHPGLASGLLARVATFHVVCAGWVLFRAQSVGDAGEMVGRMLTAGGPAPLVTAPLVAVVAALILVQQIPAGVVPRLEAQLSRLPYLAQGAVVGAWLFLCVALSPEGVAPFIYFQF